VESEVHENIALTYMLFGEKTALIEPPSTEARGRAAVSA
jgi:hypothetical protein